MKSKLLILCMFLFCTFTVGYVQAENNNLDLLGKVVYLDPGHGGKDPGALGSNRKMNEKVNNRFRSMVCGF